MQLWEYPRPENDNGRGIHWFTTQSAPNALVDTYIGECKAMHIKWVVFLNGYDWALLANDYLVQRLVENEMMPILRVYTHPTAPLPAWLSDLVRHYAAKGVRYFQLYNEPNLKGEWPNNQFPANMMGQFAEWWIDAALRVIDAGGLPGFPGLATAGGEYGLGEGEDVKFFIDALEAINARLDAARRIKLYDKLWISLHNYNMWAQDPLTTPVTRLKSHSFRKFEVYDEIVREKIGRSLPILSTEGGTRLGIRPDNPYTDTRDEKVVADHIARSFQYMMDGRAPDYFFCFCPWVLGSKIAGNNDDYFEDTAWYRADGTRQKVIDAVKALPTQVRQFSWDRPAQVTFLAEPARIVAGQKATLRWTTQGIKSVALNGAPVGLSGRQQVQPPTTTTYTLRAIPHQGAPIEQTAQVTVEVAVPTEPLQPPIINKADQLPRYPRGNAPGPYPTRPESQIQMLVIHHTNWEGVTPEKLAEYLVDKLHWPGIGYHFMIANDGTIYQTNHLTTISFQSYDGVDPYKVTKTWDDRSLGIAFVGKFDVPGRHPTPQQLASGGRLCAWLLRRLNLTEEAIWARCELMTDPSRNPSPGCVRGDGKWIWTWEDALRAEVRKYLVPPGPPITPPFYHYMLFWKHADNWAKEDWQAAQQYIARFLPTCGFSVEEALKYEYVTIVGGPFGVPESDEQKLRAAGRKVERLAPPGGFEGTAALLKQMAEEGRRFLNPNL